MKPSPGHQIYEKVASVLSSHDLPIILAKYDANKEANKELSNQFEIRGFPAIKILRNGGKQSHEYKVLVKPKE
ncbi:hypothetical protein AgCh_028747 [Apium graveolens]